MKIRARSIQKGLTAGFLVLWMISACGRPALRSPAPAGKLPAAIARLAYTIQAGAFVKVENAARLTQTLQEKGQGATYFVDRQGLYKVRFGNFPSREQARTRAEALRAAGVIEAFYIVAPEEYASARLGEKGEAFLREELVQTAQSFLGIPYLWGGSSADEGFDCSGLTMTVYQLNGFDLPRTSRDQFAAGNPVTEAALAKGDLLFFADGGKISHVGIYTGSGRFIHSPGRGKTIRIDSLDQSYFRRTYFGARSYL